VVVKPGVMDYDFDVEIGGWQGRITEVAPAGNQETVMVAWDSFTLRNMPEAMIEQCEEEGLDWATYGIEAGDVELTEPRDTETDTAQAVKEISRKYAWIYLGEEGKRINRILSGIDPDDEMSILRAWKKHLKRHLQFPFEAQIVELARRGPLRVGDRVNVQGISSVEDLYGIIVEVRHGRRRYDVLLCDLEAVDKSSSNYRVLRDYVIWFANR
jgi:hypothetical protein